MSDTTRRLDAAEWGAALLSDEIAKDVIQRIGRRTLSPWGNFICSMTAPGQSVLEIGSGTGEISLQLAAQGRRVTLLDFSDDTLRFSERCAQAIGLSVETVLADATAALPFEADTFDCVWTSGLLEHFYTSDRQFMLREQSRISRSRVISMVPNAACLIYRLAKQDHEANGSWRYGLEMPLHSQVADFIAADLQVEQEITLSAAAALNLLRIKHPLRKTFARLLEVYAEADLCDMWQGYLLATVGKKVTSEQFIKQSI